jgi:general stress protein YciG
MAEEKDKSGTSKRGFGSMDEEKQREIASKGGKAAHEEGTAHEFDSEEASEAGSKGGKMQGKENNPGNFANDTEKAREAGKKGGENSNGGNK